MKADCKAFGLAAIALYMAGVALTVPDGGNSVLAPFFLFIALIAAGFGVFARFGTQHVQQWLAAKF